MTRQQDDDDHIEHTEHTEHDADTPSAIARTALLLDTDLFFSVKVAETLKHVGYTTHTARKLEAFDAVIAEQRPTVALVNTAARGVDWRKGISMARAAGVPVVAFGSHVEIETQREARALGATSVIANSKLASDLPGVVARALHRVPGITGEPSAAPIHTAHAEGQAKSTSHGTRPGGRDTGEAEAPRASER